MNGLLILGVAVNGGVVALVGASGEYPAVLTYVMGLFFALSLLGVILVAAGVRKFGAILTMVGCIVFVPIGVIGAIGGRKVLDQLKSEAFEKRRATLNS